MALIIILSCWIRKIFCSGVKLRSFEFLFLTLLLFDRLPPALMTTLYGFGGFTGKLMELRHLWQILTWLAGHDLNLQVIISTVIVSQLFNIYMIKNLCFSFVFAVFRAPSQGRVNPCQEPEVREFWWSHLTPARCLCPQRRRPTSPL